MKRISLVLAAALFTVATGGAQNFPPAGALVYQREGIASWYGREFNGRPTASGEIFNSSLYTAAHPTLPFGTLLKITNLNNSRTVNVKVNDRGPYVSTRIIDLSEAAAQMLDMISTGTAPVLLEILGADLLYQAESNSYSQMEGSNSTAAAQIIAPVYPIPQEPVIIQVQPQQDSMQMQSQQQITQYFQQPIQSQQIPAQSPLPQQVQQTAPVLQIQPPQQASPVQIEIPIEVKPIVNARVVPVQQQGLVATEQMVIQPQMVNRRFLIKPNRIYRIQVGSYREAGNALAAFERLKGEGLDPGYERYGNLFRVVVPGIHSDRVGGVLRQVLNAGFLDPLLREER
ncbi:MAG: septal ring lytic transglycosylase RlpA family protein [Treponema sp.]|nr:septal ring lytic transglycosylase RlpA family protein [Treponema sp.]